MCAFEIAPHEAERNRHQWKRSRRAHTFSQSCLGCNVYLALAPQSFLLGCCCTRSLGGVMNDRQAAYDRVGVGDYPIPLMRVPHQCSQTEIYAHCRKQESTH